MFDTHYWEAESFPQGIRTKWAIEAERSYVKWQRRREEGGSAASSGTEVLFARRPVDASVGT